MCPIVQSDTQIAFIGAQISGPKARRAALNAHFQIVGFLDVTIQAIGNGLLIVDAINPGSHHLIAKVHPNSLIIINRTGRWQYNGSPDIHRHRADRNAGQQDTE
ncbi:hypothetical protein D3C78_1753210 [compost metagenome]